MGWFSDSFKDRTESPPKQGYFESNSDYRDRVYEEGKERIIEEVSGQAPKQGWFESDGDYHGRIAHEANERLVEKATGNPPKQGWFEGEPDYRERLHHETNARIVEGATGRPPRQGWFESDESFHDRLSHQANERIVEAATGSTPYQGFFEGDDAYQTRINHAAKDIKASGKPETSGGSSASSCEDEPAPSEGRSSFYDDDDDDYSWNDDPAPVPVEPARVGRKGRRRVMPSGGLETVWSLLSLAAEIKRNGGPLVRTLPDGRIEEVSLSGGSSFTISTCTFTEKGYAMKQRVLAVLEEDAKKEREAKIAARASHRYPRIR